MKIKTQVIDKIEDVRCGDVVIYDDMTLIAYKPSLGRITVDGGDLGIGECTVVRIAVEGDDE